MARIRTYKPELFTDEKTGPWCNDTKLLFLGLLSHADDYGVLKWSPIEWGAKIFPYHQAQAKAWISHALMSEILPSGIGVAFDLEGFEAKKSRYLCIINFNRHQVINRPSGGILRGWEKGDSPQQFADKNDFQITFLANPFSEGSRSTHGALTEHAVTERKGREGKGKESIRVSKLGLSDRATPAAEDDSGSHLTNGGF